MKRLIIFTVGVLAFGSSATADPYGTIVHKDGSMVAIYRSNSSTTVSFAANFDKNGKFSGGCVREDISAFQLRKARMKAASKWRLGYVPRKLPCRF